MFTFLLVFNFSILAVYLFYSWYSRINEVIQNEMEDYPLLSKRTIKKHCFLILMLLNLILYGLYILASNKLVSDPITTDVQTLDSEITFDVTISKNTEEDMERIKRAEEDAKEKNRERFPQTGL
jgi:uncharacterized membrane protein (DUF106 family)